MRPSSRLTRVRRSGTPLAERPRSSLFPGLRLLQMRHSFQTGRESPGAVGRVSFSDLTLLSPGIRISRLICFAGGS